MKKFLLILIIALILTISVYSQTFTEITDYGWGHGIGRNDQTCIDIDNDGLLDLILHEFDGGLVHFEQSESNSSNFNLLSESPLNNLIATKPFFIDLDSNGLLDMLYTNGDHIRRREQLTNSLYEFEIVSTNFSNLYINSDYSFSTPVIGDIDNDVLLDMIISVTYYEEYWPGQGEYYFYYYLYEQSSQNSDEFILLDNDFLNEVSPEYCSVPVLYDIDNDDLMDLFIGYYWGGILHYEQEEENSYDFSLVTQTFNNIDLGVSISPTFIDIDSNNLIDLLLSVGKKDIIRYEQITNNSYEFDATDSIITNIIDVGVRSFQTIADIDNDGLWDILIGNGSYDNWFESKTSHYEQVESNSFEFEFITDNYYDIGGNNFCGPNLFDIDNDGLLDLLISNYGGAFTHYEQSSINSYSFDFIGENFSNINEGFYSTTAFADIDNDNLLDLLIGDFTGHLHHYEQDSTNPYSFILISDNFNNIGVGWRSKPHFNDIDDDNLWDLFIGSERGWVYHYEQTSNNSYEFSLIEQQVNSIDVGYSSVPLFCDINNDGEKDLIVGSIDGGLYLYAQNPVSVEDDFVSSQGIILNQNYPNPFNPSTKISFSIIDKSNINLTIYNIKGQKIKEVANNVFDKGNHFIIWNGDDENNKIVSSGVYLYKLNVNGKIESVKKCILMK